MNIISKFIDTNLYDSRDFHLDLWLWGTFKCMDLCLLSGWINASYWVCWRNCALPTKVLCKSGKTTVTSCLTLLEGLCSPTVSFYCSIHRQIILFSKIIPTFISIIPLVFPLTQMYLIFILELACINVFPYSRHWLNILCVLLCLIL